MQKTAGRNNRIQYQNSIFWLKKQFYVTPLFHLNLSFSLNLFIYYSHKIMNWDYIYCGKNNSRVQSKKLILQNFARLFTNKISPCKITFGVD